MPWPNQERAQGSMVGAILRAGPVDEDDGRMLAAGGRRDQRAGQLHAAIREPHVFPFFDLDAFRGPRRRTVTLPRQRDDPAGAVALKTRRAVLIQAGIVAPGPAKFWLPSIGYSVRDIAGLVNRYQSEACRIR